MANLAKNKITKPKLTKKKIIIYVETDVGQPFYVIYTQVIQVENTKKHLRKTISYLNQLRRNRHRQKKN